MADPMFEDVLNESRGDVLLDDLRDHLATYIRTVSEFDLDLLTVWTLHTYLVRETRTTPRLQLDSPMPGSGKTTTCEHIQNLAFDPVLMAMVSSSALLARMLAERPRTLILDEADRALNPDKDGVADLLAVINSGYKFGASRPVLVPGKGGEWQVREMSTFSPVVIAGNAPNLPEDTRSRIIRVLLLPDLEGQVAESDWELIEDDVAALKERIVAWTDSVREFVASTRPPLPAGIVGRFREKWLPLRRVAEAAGGRWPAAVDAMAIADREQWIADKEDGLITERPHMLLLRDLATVWPKGKSFVPTADLLDRLAFENPSAWGDDNKLGKALTAQRLGRMMTSGFRVNSARPHTQGPRGYVLADLREPMIRLGIAPPEEPDKAAQPAEPDNQRACPDWKACDLANCAAFSTCVGGQS